MKKNKLIIANITIALLLSACQTAPTASDKNGMTIAQKSEEDSSSSTASVIIEENEITETEITGEDESIITDAVINKIFSNDETTININAVVSDNATDMHMFTYSDHVINNDEYKQILTAFFGSKYENLVYDKENNVYTYDTEQGTFVAEQINSHKIRISGRGINLCPYDSNKYDYNTELSFSSEEAIIYCDEFIKNAGLAGYVFSNITAYGKNEGVPYYKITYKYVLDDKYVTTEFSNSDIVFNCIESGIYSVTGNIYDYMLYNDKPTLISAEKATDILFDYSNNIMIYCNSDKNNDFLPCSDEKGRISVFNIIYVNIEYVCNYDNIIVPSWRFYLSSDDINMNKNIVLAVDAVNGDVIVR